MKSIQFPKMFTNTSTNIVEGYQATLQNLKNLLFTEKGELFGDPEFGTGLKKYAFDQNNVVLKDILIDDIYTAIATFMPQLKVKRDGIIITSDNNTIIIEIEATNMVNFVTNLYTIAMTKSNNV